MKKFEIWLEGSYAEPIHAKNLTKEQVEELVNNNHYMTGKISFSNGGKITLYFYIQLGIAYIKGGNEKIKLNDYLEKVCTAKEER